MELKGRKIQRSSLEVDGVDSTDYPDFCDAYFSYGEYDDGTKLTDEELEQLADEYGDVVNEMAYESLH
jgi:hypothetical protein